MNGKWKAAVCGVLAIGVMVLICATADAQRCGPTQVFDADNLNAGRLACESCNAGAATATARVTDNAARRQSTGDVQALSAQVRALSEQIARMQGTPAPTDGGGDVSAYAEANGGGGGGYRPLAVRTGGGGTRAEARAQSNGGYADLPPIAYSDAGTGAQATAVANANGGGGCGGGRGGFLARLASRRTVSIAKSVTVNR